MWSFREVNSSGVTEWADMFPVGIIRQYLFSGTVNYVIPLEML